MNQLSMWPLHTVLQETASVGRGSLSFSDGCGYLSCDWRNWCIGDWRNTATSSTVHILGLGDCYCVMRRDPGRPAGWLLLCHMERPGPSSGVTVTVSYGKSRPIQQSDCYCVMQRDPDHLMEWTEHLCAAAFLQGHGREGQTQWNGPGGNDLLFQPTLLHICVPHQVRQVGPVRWCHRQRGELKIN